VASRWNLREREDLAELGVDAERDYITTAASVYGNDAYHWTKTRAARDAMLREGLGISGKYFIEGHEMAAAYAELPDAARKRLLAKYGDDPYTVVTIGERDVEKAYRRANPRWSRVWVSGDPIGSDQGARAAADYGPYGVRIRLEDWLADADPWGNVVEDYAYGMGLIFEGTIPPEYLSPVDVEIRRGR